MSAHDAHSNGTDRGRSGMGLAVRIVCATALILTTAVYGERAPNITVELRDVDPTATEVPLFTNVYARIAYRTDRPVRVALRPYRNGRVVEAGASYSGSPEYPPGKGEALAWVAFSSPQHIDEVRAFATDAMGEELASASVARTVRWRDGVPAPTVASWVAPLQERADRLASSGVAPESGLGVMLLGQLVMLCVPLSLVLQVLAVRKLTGRALQIARYSAVAMAALWLFVIVTAVAGSNLSPIWIVFVSPLFVVLLSALFIVERRARRRASV